MSDERNFDKHGVDRKALLDEVDRYARRIRDVTEHGQYVDAVQWAMELARVFLPAVTAQIYVEPGRRSTVQSEMDRESMSDPMAQFGGSQHMPPGGWR